MAISTTQNYKYQKEKIKESWNRQMGDHNIDLGGKKTKNKLSHPFHAFMT